ncbi:MAG: FecR family protein [Burkholderiales bacterium]
MKRMQQLLGFAVAAAVATCPLAAFAATGTVSQLSGTLSVKRPDGSIRILSQKSEIQTGDTLNTERDSYAQIKFSDGGQVTMQPNSSVKVDNYKFSDEKPQEDSFVYSLLKGGLRAVTGIVGKRSKEKYQLGTATATIGIRGTTLTANAECHDDPKLPQCANLPPAVYVGVLDGEIVVTNAQGQLALSAGQFAQIRAGFAPAVFPFDPGLGVLLPSTFIQAVMHGLDRKQVECAIGATTRR